MKLKIEIEMDNAAFGDCDAERGDEVSRILTKLVQDCSVNGLAVGSGNAHVLRDVNGNKVGTVKVTK